MRNCVSRVRRYAVALRAGWRRIDQVARRPLQLLFFRAFNHAPVARQAFNGEPRNRIGAAPEEALAAAWRAGSSTAFGLPLALPRCPVGMDAEAGYCQTADNQDGRERTHNS